MNEQKAGPTGDYPKGKIDQSDEGGLNIAVTVKGKTLIFSFGRPVLWIGLEAEEAEQLGILLLEKAAQIKKGL